jgi:hypothetical protein
MLSMCVDGLHQAARERSGARNQDFLFDAFKLQVGKQPLSQSKSSSLFDASLAIGVVL